MIDNMPSPKPAYTLKTTNSNLDCLDQLLNFTLTHNIDDYTKRTTELATYFSTKIKACPATSDNAPSETEVTALVEDLDVYPNPVSSSFSLRSETKNVVVQLLNMSGQVVLSNLPLDTDIELPNELPNGLYCLSVQTENGYYTRKLIIQK
ncbi:MAG: Secretion system C-terminal sorting domain, partial [Bacteroidota bacterium]|jgi:hypothetical protein